jgi:hypothetical protein
MTMPASTTSSTPLSAAARAAKGVRTTTQTTLESWHATAAVPPARQYLHAVSMRLFVLPRVQPPQAKRAPSAPLRSRPNAADAAHMAYLVRVGRGRVWWPVAGRGAGPPDARRPPDPAALSLLSALVFEWRREVNRARRPYGSAAVGRERRKASSRAAAAARQAQGAGREISLCLVAACRLPL